MLVELYDRWLNEVWSQGDYAVDEELLAEHFVDHNAVPGQPGGRAGDVWAAKQIRTAFPDCRFTRDVAFEDGVGVNGLVTGRWTMSGTHTGTIEFLGIPPTGRPVTMTGQEIFRAVDGRFVEVWHAEDVGTMMRALELEPPPLVLRLAAKRSARKYKKEQRRS
jgi:predicted ester cyclase